MHGPDYAEMKGADTSDAYRREVERMAEVRADRWRDRFHEQEARADRLEAALQEAGGLLPDPMHPRFPAEFRDAQANALHIIDQALS